MKIPLYQLTLTTAIMLQDHFLTDSLLREVVDRMGRDIAEQYLDYTPNHLGVMARDSELGDNSFYPDSPSPSLRDQEYLQHSSLWGHQYMTGKPRRNTST